MRIAVVGSGPAAAATLLAILKHRPAADVRVIDVGVRPPDPLQAHPRDWPQATVRAIHGRVAAGAGGIIPPKTYFGYVAPYYPSSRVYKSELVGGLSRLWGAGLLPFTAADVAAWPIAYGDLAASYRSLLEEVPITSGNDGAAAYFPGEFTNEGSIGIPPMLAQLIDHIDAQDGFFAGRSRLAIRLAGPASCTYCDHCFYGCYRDAIYSADQTVRRVLAAIGGLYAGGRTVIAFRTLRNGRVELLLRDDRGGRSEDSFDLVFLTAGCLESTRIVALSTDRSAQPFPLQENPVFTVPVVYLGRGAAPPAGPLISLSNVLIGGFHDRGTYVHSQLYHVNAYLARHAVLRLLGPRVMQAGGDVVRRAFAGRLFMLMIYLPGALTLGSTVEFGADGDRFHFVSDPSAHPMAVDFSRRLDRRLSGSGFHLVLPLLRRLWPGASAHYAGTLPMARGRNACLAAPSVVLGDSATFPSIPAQNHTYTIMANAHRLASSVLGA